MNISVIDIERFIKAACIELGLIPQKIVLFGSRARGDFDKASDYDILLIVQNDIDIKMKMALSKKVREAFAKRLTGADIIVKSAKEADYYKDKIGSIVKNAVAEGVVLW